MSYDDYTVNCYTLGRIEKERPTDKYLFTLPILCYYIQPILFNATLWHFLEYSTIRVYLAYLDQTVFYFRKSI